jgi:hypothetical protein
MGQSVKAVVQLLAIIAFFAALVAWQTEARSPANTWIFRIASTVTFAACVGLLIWAPKRKEIIPDHLARVARSYFERDGFCFAFVPAMQNGVAWLQIYFQNRYERGCRVRVSFQPPVKSFGIRRMPLPGLTADLECEGAAFGVYRAPWPIPAEFQGKSVKYEVGCATFYPNGKGRLLRFRAGVAAGSVGGGIPRAASAGLLLVGVVAISRPATTTLTHPAGVADQVPAGLEPTVEILQRADLPTGGFPIQPGAQPAAGERA